MDKQQIKARFFGAHIGCDVSCFDTIKMVGTNLGIVPTNTGAVLCHVKYQNGVIVPEFINHCKLVLRPLSSITDMEAAECAKIMGYKDFADEMRIKYTKAALQAMLTLRIEAGRHWHCADYLRSINICLPFMGLYPIAEGWAILEKIPENEPQTKKKEEI